MSDPRTFFITHSSKDTEFARRLCDDLHKSGLQGFLDAYSIDPGDRISGRIDEGLEACDVFLPVLSIAALKSPWCKDEISAAIALSNQPSRDGRPRIIPLLVEDCAEKLPPLLRNRLCVNFTDRYLPGLWDLFVEGFKIDPKSHMHQKNMFSGPILSRLNELGNAEGWFGAYELLTFSTDDAARGKSLRVNVDSTGHELSIELWKGAYKDDVQAWARTRRDVTRSPRMRNPTLTWRIVPGTYTVYFVDQFRLDAPFHYNTYGDPLPWQLRYHILVQIEILKKRAN
jgi:TIR domain